MILGRGIVWFGEPIVSILQHSGIQIRERCAICLRSSQTASGANHRRFCESFDWAELSVGEGVRMSGIMISAAGPVVK